MTTQREAGDKNALRFGLDGPEEQNTSSTMLDEPGRQRGVNAPSKGAVRVDSLFGTIRILVQPLHERQIKTSPLVQELRRMEM